MSDDVRAAAERLRRYYAGDVGEATRLARLIAANQDALNRAAYFQRKTGR